MIDPLQRFEEQHQHALGELEKLEAAARALAVAGGLGHVALLEAV